MIDTFQDDKSWKILETQFISDDQHHLETILTQGNGYLSTRGTLEERFINDRQATLIHGLWDDVPISFTELANAPDWTSFEIWINGQLFSISQGVVSNYERHLDLRTGILYRRLTWSPDDGLNNFEISFERYASLNNQHLLVSKVHITPLCSSTKVRFRTSLNSHVENENYLHWNLQYQKSLKNKIDLLVATRKTKKFLAMSSYVMVNQPCTKFQNNDSRGCPGVVGSVDVNKGVTLVIQKFTGISTDRDADDPMRLAQQVALEAVEIGYQGLYENNLQAWVRFWNKSDIIIEGDDKAQLAIRHALFQLRIAAPTHDEKASIGAKTLSGFGYKGHVFWDTEIFILPFFTLTHPEIARNMLLYRYNTLPGARRKAAKNGFNGAQFAWESAETGDEVTPPWVPDFQNPLQLIRIWTGDIEIHISSDIAYAQYQYWQMTGDDEFWKNNGVPSLLETAMFWGDRAEYEPDGYSYRDVIGPDEYHEHVDNNVYTNRMAQWHLETAIKSIEWLSDKFPKDAEKIIAELDLTPEKLDQWRHISNNIVILQDPKTGLFEQFEGFFKLKDLDWANFGNRTKSIQELLGIEGANKHQVIKQADVIMMLCLFKHEYDSKTWKANWDYYNPRTDHTYGSSLGPAIQAWAACEMGQPDLAYEHFLRSAMADLENVRGNAEDGIHAASAGGLWQAITFGFAGLNFNGKSPTINSRIPSHWERLKFSIEYRGKRYSIEIQPDKSSVTKIEPQNPPPKRNHPH